MVLNDMKWQELLQSEFESKYFYELIEYVEEQRAKNNVFPSRERVFRALNETPFEDVKAVIIGQDPYHEVGQASGLCFSVENGIALPPSLKNIIKELEEEYQIQILPDKSRKKHENPSGDLSKWASQGVLMLNTVLTVTEGNAMSHRGHGWERFTDAVLKTLNFKPSPVVFLLWGKAAIDKMNLIDTNKHTVLTSVHPSPLSAYRGFFGCNHFRLANEYLAKNGMDEIDWLSPWC